MELDLNKSKTLKFSLLILAIIVLLSIGAAIGSHASYNWRYGNNICGRGDFDRFERNDRRGMMFNRERGQAQVGFRIIPNQTVDSIQASESGATSTPSASSTSIK